MTWFKVLNHCGLQMRLEGAAVINKLSSQIYGHIEHYNCTETDAFVAVYHITAENLLSNK